MATACDGSLRKRLARRYLAVSVPAAALGGRSRRRLEASVRGNRLRHGRVETRDGGSRRQLATTTHAVAPYDSSLWRRLAVAAHTAVASGGGELLKAMAVGGDCSQGSRLWRKLAVASHTEASCSACSRRILVTAACGGGSR